MKQILFLLFLTPLLLSVRSGSKRESGETPQYIIDYNAGLSAQKNRDYQTAIEYYNKALDQKSDFPDAWNNLGYSYRMIAKTYLDQSGEAYEKAIKSDPKHERALEYQGEYFLMMGEIKKAYENYQILKEMNSGEAKTLKKKLDNVLEEAQTVLKKYSP